jgi:hypothetical protein
MQSNVMPVADPVMVYHPDHPSRKVWRVDLHDYLAIGWSLSPVSDSAKTQIEAAKGISPASPSTPVVIEPQADAEIEIDPKTRRQNELQTIIGAEGGWKEIKEIAAIHNITKKPTGGWDEAIGLILDIEFPEVA